MKARLLTILILFTFVKISAQSFEVRHVKTDNETYPGMTSTVQVYDSFDEPITGLTKDNFAVAIDGKRTDSLKAQTYKESGLGFNIMLCLDLSGTMKGKPLVAMQKAILKFIDDMRSVDKLGIMGYGDNAELISDFSNDKDFLKQKVQKLTASGNQTALFYGAYKGIDKLAENKEKVGKILLLMGDGKDENKANSYKEEDVIESAKANGVPVFSIGFTKIDPSYLQSLEKISEKTGGNFYNSPNDEDLTKQYEKLYRQILNIYILNYLAVDVNGDGAEHINSITVTDKGASKTVSNKFIAPAGTKAASGTKIIKQKTPLYYYIIAGGIILLLAGGGYYLYRRNKQKKEEEERLRLDKERRHNEKLEEEKRKRIELENQLIEANAKKDEEAELVNVDEKNIQGGSFRGDRTMIMTPKSASAGTNFSKIKVEVLTGAAQGSAYSLTTNGATIGRKEGNSIVIKDDTVSGSHAKIYYDGSNFIIQDLNSSNGTYINGSRINTSIINQNSTFKFGKCEGKFTLFN